MHRRHFAALAVGLLAAAGTSDAFAQAYPSKPITMVVPWPAGGSTDIVMRAISEAAAKTLGQPIVTDNKPGASGTLGPAVVAATAQGAQSLFLEVADDNPAAQALYAKAGFVSVGRRTGYYARPSGRAVDALVLRRSLNTEAP